MTELDPRLAGYYRRAAVVLKLIRFFVLLGFVAFAVFCIGFFKDNITVDNLRYLLKYIDLSATDHTPSDTEIVISAGEGASYELLGNDLAVVSNNGVGLYDFAGNKLYQYDASYTDAAVVSNGKNLLVYDTAGTHLALYNAVSLVLEKKFDYDVKAAYLNDLGCFAVINSEKTYRSGVIVFDRDGGEIFRWMSPDKYLTGVALNANASVVVCSAVSNKNGAFCTEIIAYRTATGEVIAERTLDDALALKIGYADNDSSLWVLTDSAFLCFDRTLTPLGQVSYNPENARFFRSFDDLFLLAESNNLSGSSMTVRAYSYSDASLLFECRTEDRVTDAEYRDGTLYLLERDSLAVYDYGTAEKTLTPLVTLPLHVQYRAVRADGYGRYILVGAKNARRGSLAVLLKNGLAAESGAESEIKQPDGKEVVTP